jgi:hypothetical protein
VTDAVADNDRPPMRNRVTPMGDIVAIPLRGAWLGNRGILHRGTEITRNHASDLWIICALEHKDWRLPQWEPGHFTVLFFHDEAVALAAGHRPCALCRREAYDRYREAWATSRRSPLPTAKEMNRRLHGERLVAGSSRRRLHSVEWRGLPDGAFVSVDGGPWIVLGNRIVAWTEEGYGPAYRRPDEGRVEAITPPSTISALRAGYPAQIDASAYDR